MDALQKREAPAHDNFINALKLPSGAHLKGSLLLFQHIHLKMFMVAAYAKAKRHLSYNEQVVRFIKRRYE